MDLAFAAEALTQVSLPGQLLVLALMLGCAVWTALRPGVLPVVALTACGLMWSRADSRLEGAILITLAPGRGLVVADLLIPALGCVVLLAAARSGRHHEARRAAEQARLDAARREAEAARLAAAEALQEQEEERVAQAVRQHDREQRRPVVSPPVAAGDPVGRPPS